MDKAKEHRDESMEEDEGEREDVSPSGHARQKGFKKGIDPEEARRKRDQQQQAARREKREEKLMAVRAVEDDVPGAAPFGFGGAHHPHGGARPLNEIGRQTIPQWAEVIMSSDVQKQLLATTHFRKLLSIEQNPPIHEVIANGVVPRLVELLTIGEMPQLVFEACWALTNIASGSSDQTRVVLDAGAVPLFVQLLGSRTDDVREQCIWALGNIAGDSPQCRDYVLQQGALPHLLSVLETETKVTLLRNGSWTLSNLCRGKPQPNFELMKTALPMLGRLIFSTDDEVVTDACWALSYLSDGPNERIQVVLESGVVRRVVELLLHNSFSIQTPALRIVGNFVTGDDVQTQYVLSAGLLPCVHAMLSSPKKGIRKEACWTVSNITAGNRSQIQAVIDSSIVPTLIQLMKTGDADIRKEACWALSNATAGSSPEQMGYLVQQGLVEALCETLSSKATDSRTLPVALEGLENLLKMDQHQSSGLGVAALMEEVGAVDIIEDLQNHPDNGIYEKAVSILELFCPADVEEDGSVTDALPIGTLGLGEKKETTEGDASSRASSLAGLEQQLDSIKLHEKPAAE